MGLDGTNRGRVVAGLDAAGAALGCIGLAGFAMTCWIALPHLPTALVLVLATVTWIALSAAAWLLRKGRTFRHMHGKTASRRVFRNP